MENIIIKYVCLPYIFGWIIFGMAGVRPINAACILSSTTSRKYSRSSPALCSGRACSTTSCRVRRYTLLPFFSVTSIFFFFKTLDFGVRFGSKSCLVSRTLQVCAYRMQIFRCSRRQRRPSRGYVIFRIVRRVCHVRHVAVSPSVYSRIHDRRFAVCSSSYSTRESAPRRYRCTHARLPLSFVRRVHRTLRANIETNVLLSCRRCSGIGPRLHTTSKVHSASSRKRFGFNRHSGRPFLYIDLVFVF